MKLLIEEPSDPLTKLAGELAGEELIAPRYRQLLADWEAWLGKGPDRGVYAAIVFVTAAIGRLGLKRSKITLEINTDEWLAVTGSSPMFLMDPTSGQMWGQRTGSFYGVKVTLSKDPQGP